MLLVITSSANTEYEEYARCSKKYKTSVRSELITPKTNTTGLIIVKVFVVRVKVSYFCMYK